MCRFQGRAKEKKKLSDEALATLESEDMPYLRRVKKKILLWS